MTADDPRVQRAREAVEDSYHNLYDSAVVRDLLALVDDHRKVLDAQQDKWMRESVRADRAETERDRLQAIVERVTEMCRDTGNSSTGPTYVMCADVMAAINGEEVTE